MRPTVVVGDEIVDLAAADPALGASWNELLGHGRDCLKRIGAIAESGEHRMPLAGVRLAPPVQPRKFFAIGLNYADHVAESGLERAIDGVEDPVERLRAGCRAYTAFGAEHPQRYRVLFARQRPQPHGDEAANRQNPAGERAFAVLVGAVQGCKDAGRSAATSAPTAGLEIWIALHGLVTLRASQRSFPWPDTTPLVDDLVARLAQLHPC